MEISLSGRSAIVTGGSKGIGLAVATRFAESGADVAIVARGKESLDEAVAAIKKLAKARVIGVQADVGLAADIQRGYDEVMKAFGKVDIVVNNAGTSRAMPFEKVTDEILHNDIEQKLFAAVRRLLAIAKPGGILYLSWRVTDGTDQRDPQGRLYSAFESALIREAIDGRAEALLDDEPVSASSGKKIHRIVARKNAG